MERKGTIAMTREEIKKLRVIEGVIEKRLKQEKAAKLLELSIRQIKRLVKRVRREGAEGIVHRLRGKGSNRKYGEEFREKVVTIYRREYEGFGPTLAQEKMEQRNKIKIGRETLRQLLIGEGLWELQRKGREHRRWRERKECYGEMVQADGSHHDWLEGRGPKLVLMGYIDDASGKVFGGFYDYEGTLPAMGSFYQYVKRYGLPHSLYMDRHTTYQSNQKLTIEEELAGKEKSLSQFGRALKELGVELIAAQSPQAKGRIERLFRTFQDRLIKEMRLAGIKSKDSANEFLKKYLPEYNRRFCVKPRSQADLHRAIDREKDLKQILSIQTQHVLRNDNTIRHENQLYQILNRWESRRPESITVQERVDGKIYLVAEGKELRYQEIQEPCREKAPVKKKVRTVTITIPSMEHPWKKKSFERYLRTQELKKAA